METNSEQIQELIAALDGAVPGEGGYVFLGHESILADEPGFLRLGVACLKAAYAPPEAPLSFNDLVDEYSEYFFGEWQRLEPGEVPVRAEPYVPTLSDRLMPFLLGAGCLVVVSLLMLGLGTLVTWIF